MNDRKIIIGLLILIIAILLVGIFAVMPSLEKQDTNLKFKSKSTLTEGDSIKVKLTQSNGTAIAGQTVNITITDSDNSASYYSVVTDDDGIGTLKLDKAPGKYVVDLNYGGNGKYNGCDASKKITVEKKVAQAEVSGSSSTSNNDPGAFYSAQSGRVIYTGEVHDAPDGHKWKHLGYNEWVKID